MNPRLRVLPALAMIAPTPARWATGSQLHGQIMRMTAKIGAATLSLAATFAPAQAAGPAASPQLLQAASQCFGKTPVGWQQMIAACTTVVKEPKVSPQDKAGAYYNRGSAYVRLGDGPKALADFNEALRLKPGFSRALQTRAGIYISQRKFDAAIQDLDKAILIDPKASAAFNNRAMAYMGKKDGTKAVADLTKAIELDPKDPVSYTTRGSAYLIIGDKAKAMDDLSKAIAMDSKQTVALYNRGMLYAEKGDKAKAKADFEAVLAITPNHKDAKIQLQALAKLGA